MWIEEGKEKRKSGVVVVSHSHSQKYSEARRKGKRKVAKVKASEFQGRLEGRVGQNSTQCSLGVTGGLGLHQVSGSEPILACSGDGQVYMDDLQSTL